MPSASDAASRELHVGSVVTTFNEALGAWAAAIVVHMPDGAGPGFSESASVLELDWSGSDAPTLSDVKDALPLNGPRRLAYTNHAPTLPRSYTIIGELPPPDWPRSNSYTPRWTVGRTLAVRQEKDSGTAPVRTIKCTPDELLSLPARDDVWKLEINDIDVLDCREVTSRYPHLTELSLNGRLGTLDHAGVLNDLRRLKLLSIGDLFGMTAADVYRVADDTQLDALYLHNIPADYAAATRKLWKSEIVHGTTLEVIGARSPDWVTENRDNPFREWDTRPHLISAVRYRKALALYKTTRDTVRALLTESTGEALRVALDAEGRRYAEAFNFLDGTRSPFIETVERDEIFASLAWMLDGQALTERQRHAAVAALSAGVEATRNW